MKKLTLIILLTLNFIIGYSQDIHNEKLYILNELKELKINEGANLEVLKEVKDIPLLLSIIEEELKNADTSSQKYMNHLLLIAVNIDRIKNKDTSNSIRVVDLLLNNLLSKKCIRCNEENSLLSYNSNYLSPNSRVKLKTVLDQHIFSQENLKLIAAFNYLEYYDTIYKEVLKRKILEIDPINIDDNFFYKTDNTLLLVLAKFGNKDCDKKYMEFFETRDLIQKKGAMKAFSFMKTPESIKTLIRYLNTPGKVKLIDDYYEVPLNQHALKELVLIFREVKLPRMSKEYDADIRGLSFEPGDFSMDQLEAARKIFNDKSFLKRYYKYNLKDN